MKRLISATQIESYVYCPESWRLTYIQKQPNQNVQQLARGEAEHVAWQHVERRAGQSKALAVLLMIIALVGLLALLAR